MLLLCGCSKPAETTVSKPSAEFIRDERYRQEMDEVRKNIRDEVHIKLKRDGKNKSYSWEISGKDANAVLKANETLTKKLDK
jgi:hypothetical protein